MKMKKTTMKKNHSYRRRLRSLKLRSRKLRSRSRRQHYTKKRKNQNRKKMYFSRGGNGGNIVNPATLQSMPNQVYSLPSGASSATDAAQKYLSNMSAQQNELNHSLHNGGGGGKKKRKQKGGDSDYYSCEAPNPNITTVAQFSSSGPDVSPLNSNNSSVATNATSIAGQNNALNDCYATGTCQETDCSASSSGGSEASAVAPSDAAATIPDAANTGISSAATDATSPMSSLMGGKKRRKNKSKKRI